MKLTPDALVAAYEFLRAMPPARRWKLPHADEVEFSVIHHKKNEADHLIWRGRHAIRVAANQIVSTDNLLVAMAHEMIHAYQDGVLKSGSRRVVHNAEFRRLSKRMCTYHGWNIHFFIGE